MNEPLESPRDPETNIQPGSPRREAPPNIPADSEANIQPELPRIDLPAGASAADDRDNELPSLVNITRKPNLVREYQRVLAEYTPYVWVTPLLLAVNIGVFLAMASQGMGLFKPQNDILLAWGANFAPQTLQGEVGRLVTSMFIHLGIIHLAVNMLNLALSGYLFERFFGNVGFLLLYFFAGIAGNLASAAWHANVITAGASGALFGIFGAILAVAVRQRHALWPELVKELRTLGLSFLTLNLLIGFTVTGIDWAANLGGLASGFVAGLVLSQPLTPDIRTRRMVRNIGFALVGFALLGIATWSLQGYISDFHRAVQHFAQVEARAIPLVNNAAQRAQAKQITDAELAEILEKQVLPEWSEARQRLQALDKLTDKEREVTQLYLDLARNRQEGWELVVEGVRTNNPLKFMDAQAKQNAAEAVIGRINALQKK